MERFGIHRQGAVVKNKKDSSSHFETKLDRASSCESNNSDQDDLPAKVNGALTEQAPPTGSRRQHGRSSLTYMGKLMKNTVMAPVVASQAVVNASVKGTQAVAKGTAGMAVAGAKGVVEGSKALMDGTGAVVGYGGRTVVAGATGLVKITKAATHATTGVLFTSSRSAVRSASKWDQGLACIESLLDPESATFQAMTPEQRQQLAQVKKLLLKGPSSSDDKIAHIPMDLIQEQKQAMRYKSIVDNGEEQDSADDPNNRTSSARASSTFILQEFAGIRNAANLIEDMSDSQDDEEGKHPLPPAHKNQAPALPTKDCEIEGDSTWLQVALEGVVSKKGFLYTPPEYTALDTTQQQQLFYMLTWDSLSNWAFDIFELDSMTNGHALLFMGWAILGYPHAQKAMASCCGLLDEHEFAIASTGGSGYSFMDDLKIPPSRLCNYVRAVEKDYHEDNPYHNAIHAADVLQSLHSLIQMTGGEGLFASVPKIDLFAILLAAVVHDIDHPGKTNGFHANLRSELAVIYNDNSILENWHVAKAFAHMLGVDLNKTKSSIPNYQSANNRKSEFNILTNVKKEDFAKIRSRVIEAVLHTDMTKHFATVNAMKGLLIQEDEDPSNVAWKVLMYMLHLADISGQAKPDPLFRQWTVRVTDEFFDQGDLEAELGLPISPNCNRATTKIAGAQIGFIKFVIAPAYEILGQFIPAVQSDILPIIESNLNVWISEDEI